LRALRAATGMPLHKVKHILRYFQGQNMLFQIFECIFFKKWPKTALCQFRNEQLCCILLFILQCIAAVAVSEEWIRANASKI
jgi:hypothetical protein